MNHTLVGSFSTPPVHGVHGNFASGMHSQGSGSGVIRRKGSAGHITVSGKAGEVFRFTSAEYFNNVSQTDIWTQASIGSVKVYTTLADPDLALSPVQDTGDHWVVDHTAAPGVINQMSTYAVALKVEFLADAIIYIVGN